MGWPTAFPTVDIAITNSKGEILLGRRANTTLFRFIGGHVDPSDLSFEDAAIRELDEETGLKANPLHLRYIGNTKILDPRYEDSVDGIITLLFRYFYIEGAYTPKDDMEGGELKWFKIDKIQPDQLAPEHGVLIIMLLKLMKIKKNKFLN